MTFEEEKEYYQKRVCEVFNGYSNSYGAEDPLEICVIRDGYRAICKASERIKQLEAEVERLEKENLKLSNEVEYLLTKRLSGEDKTDVMAMCCETLEKIRQDLQITEIKRTIQDLKIAMKSDRDFEDIMNGTYEQRKEGDD